MYTYFFLYNTYIYKIMFLNKVKSNSNCIIFQKLKKIRHSMWKPLCPSKIAVINLSLKISLLS